MITYNRLDYTRLALEGLLELDYPILQIVIWDNASTDGTVQYLRDRTAGVSHVRLELSPTNKGVVFPMNTVWGSDREAVVLAKIDNDTLVPPDLLRRLAQCHSDSRHFGVLSGFHFRKQGEAIADERAIVSVNGTRVFRQKYVGGCAVMIRREVYEEVGPIPSCTLEPLGPLTQPFPQRPQRGDGARDSLGQASVGRGSDSRDGSHANRPFMDGGWTWYQQRLDELGYINGYPWPFVHVDHMEDTRSEHCIRTVEHEQYKHALRGMSLDEFTQELCVWRPH